MTSENDAFLFSANENEFAKRLHEEVGYGYGFVPFIGAGLSAPSGVPLIWELSQYLRYCICLATGLIPNHTRPWNPRTDRWPSFSHCNSIRLEVVTANLLTRSNEYSQWAPERRVLQEAIGAIAEWRSSLQFLSRITLAHDRQADSEVKAALPSLRLDAPKQEIIDSCLRHALSGRLPTLGHKMLAALGGVLRLDTMISMNFDDLLERAFEQANNPLTVFDVSLEEQLPDWSAIEGHRALIKMHGSKQSLRADYSLDRLPASEEFLAFLNYLSEPNALENEIDNRRTRVKNHLLVVGASGLEARMMSFLTCAWNELDDQYKTFWICYSDKDRNVITRFCESQRKAIRKAQRAVIIQHSNPGLLFLNVFQHFRFSIPAIGVPFPSNNRVSLPPRFELEGPALASLPLAKDVSDLLTNWLDDHVSSFEVPAFHLITSSNEVHGLTAVGSAIFDVFETKANCLWIDMNDVSSVADLFEQLLDAMFFKLGKETWLPIFVADDMPSRAEEIQRLSRQSSQKWIVFLNARETPGANSVDFNRDEARPNGWIDDENPADVRSPEACLRSFISFLSQVSPRTPSESRIHFVLMMRNNSNDESIAVSKISEMLLSTQQPFKLSANVQGIPAPEVVTRSCMEWASNIEQKRFLSRLVLMQRTRFPSSLMLPESAATVEEQKRWLLELKQKGLVRLKLGGYVWCHATCRNKLRELLCEELGNQETSELHWQLCHEYVTLHAVSNSPLAIFEAVYHAIWSADDLCLTGDPNSGKVAGHRIEFAAQLLSHHGFLIQTIGYSRGSCRRLENLLQLLSNRRGLVNAEASNLSMIKESCHNLRKEICELLRAIAREVGEYKKAYERHRAIGQLLIGKDRVDIGQFSTELAEACKFATDFCPAIEWLRWWRWNAMLAYGSRSYKMAQSSIDRALDFLSKNMGKASAPIFDGDTGQIDRAQCIKLICDCLQSATTNRPLESLTISQWNHFKIEVLRILEQYFAIKCQLFALDRRNGKLNRDEIAACRQSLESAIGAANSVSPDTFSRNVSTNVAWCKNRLLLHASNLHVFESNFEASMASLNDAMAAFEPHDASRFGTDRGIVELYRAETKIAQAMYTKWNDSKGSETTFAELMDKVVGHFESNAEDYYGAIELLRGFGVKLQNSEFRPSALKSLALVKDAMRFLKRSDSVIAQKRRNTAWTTWYFHRRLMAVSLSVWCSIDSDTAPIPFLGIESSPEGDETLADKLLDQAIRLIRYDAYRLAAMVDDYSKCCLGLRCRLLLDRRTHRMVQRQQQMVVHLSKARDTLLSVVQKRHRWFEPLDSDIHITEEQKIASQMDQKVEVYIKQVVESSKRRINALRYLTP